MCIQHGKYKVVWIGYITFVVRAILVIQTKSDPIPNICKSKIIINHENQKVFIIAV